MKWKAQVRLNKESFEVMTCRDFPDGVCVRNEMKDENWEKIPDISDAILSGGIWVKVEFDDGWWP